jgi:ferredoxin, 2Fe-2S
MLIRIILLYGALQYQGDPTMPRDMLSADAPFLQLNVRLTDGSHFKPEAAAGFRVMELIRAYGLPIKAECGGAGVCATCHVRIPTVWQSLLPPASEEELAKLDEIPGADETSRLACQLMMTDALDGLEVEVQADSLETQSSWIAG